MAKNADILKVYVRLLLSERDEFFTGKMTQRAQKENRRINTKVQRKYFTPVGFTLQHFHSHHKNSKIYFHIIATNSSG